MDTLLIVIVIFLASVTGVMLVVFLRRNQDDQGASRLETTIDSLALAQTELTGRLSQLAESSAVSQAQLSEHLQAQERAVTKTLNERLADLTRRVGENSLPMSQLTLPTLRRAISCLVKQLNLHCCSFPRKPSMQNCMRHFPR